jgi:hypothetical protein
VPGATVVGVAGAAVVGALVTGVVEGAPGAAVTGVTVGAIGVGGEFGDGVTGVTVGAIVGFMPVGKAVLVGAPVGVFTVVGGVATCEGDEEGTLLI